MLNSVVSREMDEFLSRIGGVLVNKFESDKADRIKSFARLYFASAPIEELMLRDKNNLYGVTVASWEFMQNANLNKAKVRVYNPDLEQHGWENSHTVIEILAKDSPFIVDSIRVELNRRAVVTHFLNNIVLNVVRNTEHQLQSVHSSQEEVEGASREALIYLEVGRISNRTTLKSLQNEIAEILKEVNVAVQDFPATLKTVGELIRDVKSAKDERVAAIKDESVEFLNWLIADHFTFLGYQEYLFKDGQSGQGYLVPKVDSKLGLIRVNQNVDMLDDSNYSLIPEQEVLVFAKSASRSRIHRPAYYDLLVVKKFDEHGEWIGEAHILGLYTSRVYASSPRAIPIVRHKLQSVMKNANFSLEGHNGKAVVQIMETLPRDELFQMDEKHLQQTVMAILHMQERPAVRLFMRSDPFCRFISALIYAPRDIYSTELREKFQQILSQQLPVSDVEYNVQFSESILARAHIILKVSGEGSDDEVNSCTLEFDKEAIEKRLVAAARNWDDDLVDALLESFGEEQGLILAEQFSDGFPYSYQEDFIARSAVHDIQKILELENNRLGMSLYRALEDEQGNFRIKLYRPAVPFPFSEVVPVLENLGLTVQGIKPHEIRRRNGERYFVNDLHVSYAGGKSILLDDVKTIFQEAFDKIWHGEAENDGFNRLVLAANLDWRNVAMLRGYARYLQQTGFALSQTYIEAALVKHGGLARDLAKIFDERFNPNRQIGNSQREDRLVEKFHQQLDAVENLDEDRILHRYLTMIQSTVRTNFFQHNNNGERKDYIAFKFLPEQIPDLPKPLPKFEIFVYSPRMEGVHLRGGKVARGGLRWSDRKEDFRTEVLGLVKAQQVKNSVIVPVGAKGGFVCKALPQQGSRDTIMEEVVRCYKTFIRALLDITDNLVQGQVVAPENVVRKDEDDYYLVVAADKGTATFSDIANEIAKEYRFWLGDAFASGGSVGYDHKKMGITARGAWVSVQRHFRELGIDVQHDSITVLGIGDMSGDVFGNGLLCSPTLKLVAAFNHQHIFIDPDPEPQTSYQERQRLFALPRSSWTDYNSELISSGGGVFSRSAKSITITPEMRERFQIESSRLTPTEFISELIKSPVDLIWNGGIGTYIKAETELNSEVGDKANDALRVNGCQVKARVIGEGGNLGVTQLGRVEYALQGGRSNTDFVDNSGGVDCSDHEVNLKILLNDIVDAGDLTEKQRNKLLLEVTDEVAKLVLHNNYRQAQALSIAESDCVVRLDEYKRLIYSLESEARLDRAIEFIPSDEEISERKNEAQGLTRPELSILLSYVKSKLKEELSDSELPNDEYCAKELSTSFPAVVTERYSDQLKHHKLRNEMIATQIANSMVNLMGITFVNRMVDSTGRMIPEIAGSFMIARDIFDLESVWQEIEALDFKVAARDQMEFIRHVMRLVRRTTRWFLRNRRHKLDVAKEIAHFKPGVQQILSSMEDIIDGIRATDWREHYEKYLQQGFSENLANLGASTHSLLPVLGVIEAAECTGRPVVEVAKVYFNIGGQLDLYWLANAIDKLRVENHWQALAREAFRDDLEWQQRALAVTVFKIEEGSNVVEKLECWKGRLETFVGRWHHMMSNIKSVSGQEFAMYAVALRELRDLAQTATYK